MKQTSPAASGVLEALVLAEDVLSRAPFSTAIWPNGVHPQSGITKIRNAIASLSSQPDNGEIAKIISIWSDIAPGTKKAIQEEHFMLAECMDKLVNGDGK